MAKKQAEAADTNASRHERAFRKTKARKGSNVTEFPEVGTFDCTFLRLDNPEPEPGSKDNMKAIFEYEGAEYTVWHGMTGKAAFISLPLIKALAMIICGTTDEEEYDDWDPKCKFISALQGIENDYSEIAAEYLGVAQVRVKVTKGGDRDDGGWFRNCYYSAVPEVSKSKGKKAKRA